MLPFNLKENESEQILKNLIQKIHVKGAIEAKDLEALAYIKTNFNTIFREYENTIVYILGLFYKVEIANDLLSFIYSEFKISIESKYGETYTPIQASILSNLAEYENFSFSAPTSVGKSHLFRTLIKNTPKNIIFIVPTRSLIYEYLLQLNKAFKEDSGIQVQQFVDLVNNNKTTQRIFVTTPERAMDIFTFKKDLDLSLFVFDEAQISEEKERGVTFDAFVRKVDRKFSNIKKIFAHPFIENPEAQLDKHDLRGCGISYKQHVVGKIYLEFNKTKNEFNYFTPFIIKPHLKANKKRYEGDFVLNSLRGKKKILVYISKSNILDSSFVASFKHYIDECEIIQNEEAIKIIEKVSDFIGYEGKHSLMLQLLWKGIVIHHGSIPLQVRSLLEEFTLGGHANMCFCTSTLLQGVNMPFDIVWIYGYRFIGSEEDRVLGIKNLIGRAGRSTKVKGLFDIGYVLVSNPEKFSADLQKTTSLSSISILDNDDRDSSDEIQEEFIDSIKKETFDEEFKLPTSRVERLNSKEVMSSAQYLIENLFKGKSVITGEDYKKMSRVKRDAIKAAFRNIYEMSLGRELTPAEKTVISKGITILLWQIQGRSFKEILRLRYLYLVDHEQHEELKKKLNLKEIDRKEYDRRSLRLPFGYSALASSLPNKNLKRVNVFRNQTLENFNYDLLVYDTYDYLDKVISFSLADVFCAVFSIYHQASGDSRALSMKYFFKYGTDDETDIMLLRYGFAFEDIKWIRDYVEYVDESEIVFTPTVKDNCTNEQLEKLRKYL